MSTTILFAENFIVLVCLWGDFSRGSPTKSIFIPSLKTKKTPFYTGVGTKKSFCWFLVLLVFLLLVFLLLVFFFL